MSLNKNTHSSCFSWGDESVFKKASALPWPDYVSQRQVRLTPVAISVQVFPWLLVMTCSFPVSPSWATGGNPSVTYELISAIKYVQIKNEAIKWQGHDSSLVGLAIQCRGWKCRLWLHTNCGIAPDVYYEDGDKYVQLFALNLTCNMRKDHRFRGLPIPFPKNIPFYHVLHPVRWFKNVNDENKKQVWKEESTFYLLNPAIFSLFSVLVWICKSHPQPPPPKKKNLHEFQTRYSVFRDGPFVGDPTTNFWACEWIYPLTHL